MKLSRFCAILLGMTVLISASSVRAEGWEMPDLFPQSQKKSSTDLTQTLKKIDVGTKKFIRGTVDVITLRPLWDHEEPQHHVDPWMRHTLKTEEKKPFWASWFTSEEQPKRITTVSEWIGMDRPE